MPWSGQKHSIGPSFGDTSQAGDLSNDGDCKLMMSDRCESWAILSGEDEYDAELLSEVEDCARRAQQATRVCAVWLRAPQSNPPELTHLYKASRLYLLEDPHLAHYTTAAYTAALSQLITQYTPALIALSATANGRDLAPRLAARLHLPFAANCPGFDLRDDTLFTQHVLYEGRAYAQSSIKLHGRPALLTLLPGVRGMPAQSGTGQQPEIISCPPALEDDPARVRRLSLQAPSPDEIELEAAERIVAGGRGIGREGFTVLANFAHRLGAAVGASRVATDQNWTEQSRQIGATGKIVHPQLYIACGISGAAQHTSGMSDSHTVIAINPDRHAPIFALTDLGLLGDANQILALATQLLDEDRNI